MQKEKRVGNFCSSEIVALLSMASRDMSEEEMDAHRKLYPKSKKRTIECMGGRAAITYINQCNMERRLKRPLESEMDSRATNWGKFVEALLFKMLDGQYSYNSHETLVHPQYNCWVGSPDGFSKVQTDHKGEPVKFWGGTPSYGKRKVADAKCPFTIESFCKLVNPLYDGLQGIAAMLAIRDGYTDKSGLFHPAHSDGDKFYWQLVSNACITNCEEAELIVYCPYESEIEVIKTAAQQSGQPSEYFIAMGENDALPYIPDNGYYSNINCISFEVPEQDKKRLTDSVEWAKQYLIAA